MRPRLHSQAAAFGKVILFGEHSVVYGHPALAAGIPDGIHLSATETGPGQPLRLRVADWNVDLELRPGQDDPLSRAVHEVMSHCDGPVMGWDIDGRATIPARAGCGSSAALCVALARLVLGPDAEAAEVVDASMAGERIFHGTPSGLDSEIATRGGVLRYTRADGVEPQKAFASFPLVVANTCKPRSTATQVANVRARRTQFPTIIEPTLMALGSVIDAAWQSIISCNYNELGELMNVSHELLSALGVSCDEVEGVVAAAKKAGALGAKLTGAGGGGCILAVPAGSPAELVAALQARDIEAFSMEVRP
ncbi:MAG: mevalonate kinase [Nannocystaceae bacterium]